jgi:acyl carrier protein
MAEVTEQQILERVRAQLAEIKIEGAEEATMETTWQELDVDSLDLVELVKALEDEYGIAIADDDLKPIASVGDAVRLTLRLRDEAGVTS